MTIIDSMLGRNKPTVEEYKSHMPLLDAKNPIVVSFHELDGREKQEYKGKYKIEASKGGKTVAYVVVPNGNNEAVIRVIAGKLNGGEEKVTGPSAELIALTNALTDAVDKFVATDAAFKIADAAAAAAADKITADAADAAAADAAAAFKNADAAANKITAAAAAAAAAAADAAADAADKITDDAKSYAIAKVKEAIKKVNEEIAKVKEASGLQSILGALEEALAALETLAPAKTTGGYNSAKSAVPKRITRIRRTRRSAKRTGTRRRLHI